MAKKAQLDEVRPVLEATDAALDKIEGFLDGLDKAVDKGTDVVEAGLEKVADVVPDALDTSVHVSTKGGRKLVHFFRNPKNAAVSALILAGLVGAGLGTAGYFLAVKRLKSKMQAEFDEQLESEIAEMRRQFLLYNKEGVYSTPAGAAKELLPEDVQTTLKNYSGVPKNSEDIVIEGPPIIHAVEELSSEDREAVLADEGFTGEQITEILGEEAVDLAALREKMKSGTPVNIVESTNNIFLDGRSLDDFDYAAEVAKRDPSVPYVITHDEYMENENDWVQQSLTYFNGDDVLVDDLNMPIPDIEDIVDSENLTKFGHGSRDPNVVYVRNERIESDFAITLRQDEFSNSAAGVNELKHSAPIRRFRGEDE